MTNLLTKKELNHIHMTCSLHNISKYEINNDGSINVDGNVNIRYDRYDKLPIKFNIVTGNFSIYRLQLKTLEGSPKEVGGYFDCAGNELTSLEGAPVKVGKDFICNNNKITTMEFCPKEIGGNINCRSGNLVTLEGCPEKIGGTFCATDNKLTTLLGLPVASMDKFALMGNDSLPEEIKDFLYPWTDRSDLWIKALAKYQSHYNVWTPEFNPEGFQELRADIEDGLE